MTTDGWSGLCATPSDLFVKRSNIMATEKTNSTTVGTDMVLDHKCLLYWHSRSLHSIPLKNDKRLYIFPGYNAFDFSELDNIVKECKDLIDSRMITLWGIEFKANGNPYEVKTLSKIDMKELNRILDATYSEDTLAVLSNPDVVPAVYSRYAVERSVKLKEATGTEADNIEVHTPQKGI